MNSEQYYNVGDTVRIVSHPCECVFHWNSEMDKYCGKFATIKSIEWRGDPPYTRGYYLSIDGEDVPWIWGSNCFSLVERRPESQYQIGDEVVIVDEPYRSCVFSWIEEMDEYCGKRAIICGKKYDARECEYDYSLAFDGEEVPISWCDKCFCKDEGKTIEVSQDDLRAIL